MEEQSQSSVANLRQVDIIGLDSKLDIGVTEPDGLLIGNQKAYEFAIINEYLGVQSTFTANLS